MFNSSPSDTSKSFALKQHVRDFYLHSFPSSLFSVAEAI
jgi:hypothetical protein